MQHLAYAQLEAQRQVDKPQVVPFATFLAGLGLELIPIAKQAHIPLVHIWRMQQGLPVKREIAHKVFVAICELSGKWFDGTVATFMDS